MRLRIGIWNFALQDVYSFSSLAFVKGSRRGAPGFAPVSGAARELARNSELVRRDGPIFELVVPKAKAYLAERSYIDKLKAALEQHVGSAVTVKVAVGELAGASPAALEAGAKEARRTAAAEAVKGDGFVQDLVNMFDGKVVDSTIREDRK